MDEGLSLLRRWLPGSIFLQCQRIGMILPRLPAPGLHYWGRARRENLTLSPSLNVAAQFVLKGMGTHISNSQIASKSPLGELSISVILELCPRYEWVTAATSPAPLQCLPTVPGDWDDSPTAACSPGTTSGASCHGNLTPSPSLKAVPPFV